jgi:phosphoserine phosphatase
MLSRLVAVILVSLISLAPARGAEPLPSWNDTASRQAILRFVGRVTAAGSTDFVPVPERIAVFDNDGTLWSEQPVYNQAAFIVDRVKALAPEHPEWTAKDPFASILKGDLKGALASGEQGLVELVTATHSGMTTDEFGATVDQMLELLDYLRANGFKTFIVSGGGTDFMRPWVERVYGIPPEQTIGTTADLKFEMQDGKPRLRKLPTVDHVDDKAGKPVGIHRHIGRRPIAAFGNSDGDLQMLQWTCAGAGARLCLYVHHTDAQREWAYDRESHIGRLYKGLDEAAASGWTVVDMKRDWNRVFPTD